MEHQDEKENNYEFIKTVGCGDNSTVYKVRDRESLCQYAMKEPRTLYNEWKEVVALPEVYAARKLNSKNIVKLKDVILSRKGVLSLVYEFMDSTLETLLETKSPLIKGEH